MQILEGKPVAEAVYAKLKLELPNLPVVPKLVVLIVGEDSASQTYVRSKTKKCADLGFLGETIVFPGTVSQDELNSQIDKLNSDPSVHGILMQLPLPDSLSKPALLERLNPLKDVDGLHPENAGKLAQGSPRFVPCTPAGIVEILRYYSIPMSGKKVVVIGRSEIVGKPVAQLMLLEDATVTVCHSKTSGLMQETRQADILIVAAGRHSLVTKAHVKQGATVIDVGIHRLDGRLEGDVVFEDVAQVAAGVTPVPGGVGPMTIAMLMRNVVLAARLQS